MSLVVLGAIAGDATAIKMPLVLDKSTATLSAANPQSDFYELKATKSGKESGTGTGIFDYFFGNDDALGDYIQLTWEENPKPFLTGLGLMVSGRGSAADGLFSMFWDANGLKGFNDSSSYDGIRILQNGIVHHKRSEKYLGISYIAASGRAGSENSQVPDSGSAFAMLGVGIGILFVLRRTMKGA